MNHKKLKMLLFSRFISKIIETNPISVVKKLLPLLSYSWIFGLLEVIWGWLHPSGHHWLMVDTIVSTEYTCSWTVLSVFSQNFKVQVGTWRVGVALGRSCITVGPEVPIYQQYTVTACMFRGLHEVFVAKPKTEPTRLNVSSTFDLTMFIISCDCFCWMQAKFLCLCSLLTCLL